MKRLLSFLLLLAAAAHADDDLGSRIEDAMDLEAVNALRAEVEAIAKERPDAPETVALLRKLARAYWLNSDGHEEAEIILRIEAIPGVELDAFECRVLGDKYLRERRFEKARERFAKGLARVVVVKRGEDDEAGDGEVLRSRLREDMGEALEGLGRWEEALGYHESWRPDTGCGNCNAAENARRRASVARCTYRVGLVREALAALWKQCSEPAELLGCGDVEAFAHYAEFCVREGLVDKLKAQFDGLSEELREDYARVLVVAEAFAGNDAATIVRTVCNNPDDFYSYGVQDCCGRMLDDCVPSATSALTEALKAGGFHAVELAGHTHLKPLLPQLKSQLADKPDAETEGWLRWAIPRLEALP